MILSKANLLSIGIVKKQSDQRLENLHIDEDGNSIVSNSSTLMVVSPVQKNVKDSLTFYKSKGKFKGGTVTAETIKAVLKYLPKDRIYNGLLEHCKFDNGTFEIYDGKRKQRIEAKMFKRKFIKFKEILKKVGAIRFNTHVAINLKTLLNTLQTIDKISQNTTSEQPIYLSLNHEGDLLIRSENPKTGQRVLAYTKASQKEGASWLKKNFWELRLFQKMTKVKRQ